MSLTPAQIAALRELGEVWPGRDMVIIGATALGFYYDMLRRGPSRWSIEEQPLQRRLQALRAGLTAGVLGVPPHLG